MAEGESVSNWPSSVSFNDDDPDKGYAFIHLGVPGLEVTKCGRLLDFLRLGKDETNVTVESNFENGVIEVRISFPEPGNSTVFEYKKKAPASGIDPEKCEILYSKTQRVIIKLKKAKNESWAREKDYFTEKPKEKLND